MKNILNFYIYIYSLIFRKSANNIEIGSYYINDRGKLVRIMCRDYDVFTDNEGVYWAYNLNHIAKKVINMSWDTGDLSEISLFQLNNKDKKKYWTKIIKGETI